MSAKHRDRTPKWDPARLHCLRDVAAELYPCEADQRRLASEAELRESSISFANAPDHSWSAILEHANKQGKVDRVLDVLVDENKKNDLLRRIKAGQPAAMLRGPELKDDWQGPSDASAILERVLGKQSALVPVSYLETGLRRARSVVKVLLQDGSAGSGSLIGDNILLTNNHVLPDANTAKTAVAQFNYQQTADGLDEKVVEMKLKPDDFFMTSKNNDWAAVRVAGNPKKDWGTLSLRPAKLGKNDRVNIIQHPAGGPKQISFFSNLVVFVGKGRVQYLTDTLPGSSGSPVFDRDWNVVALHHSGGWMREPGTGNARSFFRNEGILIDVVIRALSKHMKLS